MAMRKDNLYDVFVSYSPVDQDWVRGELLPKLEQAGLKVAIDFRDFAHGVPRLVNIERAIERSRKILLVLTPAWVTSEAANLDALLAQSADLNNRLHNTIPLLLAPCEIPKRIAILTYADFTDPAERGAEMARLLRGLGTRARIFISYKRHTSPDEPLAERLYQAFEQAGHSVFMDQRISVGAKWAIELERQIEASDFFVVLLSASAVQSEMVAREVEHAHTHHQRSGKAQLLPVRVNYDAALPYQLSYYLDPLQYAAWASNADDEQLIRQLLDAVSNFQQLPQVEPQASLVEKMPPSDIAPRPHADPREPLRPPGGSVRPGSKFYIVRDGDDRLEREVAASFGTTTTIRAPRQTGKTSLLIRGCVQAQQQNYKVVFIDLQRSDNHRDLRDLDAFLYYFAMCIVTRLWPDNEDEDPLEEAWRGRRGASDKISSLIEDVVLPHAGAPVVLAIDEADMLLKTDFHDSVFGLLRSWHNSRASNDIWDRLKIIMAISTEPQLLIRDTTQSPFNVGTTIMLSDFTAPQVAELNQRYESPLDEGDLSAAMAFLGGHPYLTRKVLYTLRTEDTSWSELIRATTAQSSPFGDHLRYYSWLLRDKPQLRKALKQVIAFSRCSDSAFYQLSQAGLIKGDSSHMCECRCGLYAEYFKATL